MLLALAAETNRRGDLAGRTQVYSPDELASVLAGPVTISLLKCALVEYVKLGMIEVMNTDHGHA